MLPFSLPQKASAFGYGCGPQANTDQDAGAPIMSDWF